MSIDHILFPCYPVLDTGSRIYSGLTLILNPCLPAGRPIF